MAVRTGPEEVQRRVRESRVGRQDVHVPYATADRRRAAGGMRVFVGHTHSGSYEGVSGSVYGSTGGGGLAGRGHEPLRTYLRNAFEAYSQGPDRTSAHSAFWQLGTAGGRSSVPPAADESLYRTVTDLLQQFVDATVYTTNFLLLQRMAALEEQVRRLTAAHAAALPAPAAATAFPHPGAMRPAPTFGAFRPSTADAPRGIATVAPDQVAGVAEAENVLSAVRAQAPKITTVFAEAFGIEPTAVSVAADVADGAEADRPEDEPRVYLTVDVRAADPDLIDTARERGARADFVGALTDLLAPDVLEQLKVVYRFPRRSPD